MTRQSVPATKRSHCECHLDPCSALRGLSATFKGTVGRTSSRPPPTSAAPSTPTRFCGIAKTNNKVPGVVKVEDEEVPNKNLKIFKHFQLSLSQMLEVPPADLGSHLHHRQVAWQSPLNLQMIRRRSSIGETVHSKQRHDWQGDMNIDILDLSWKEWTAWYAANCDQAWVIFFCRHCRSQSFDHRRSRSRSVSTSVTRRTGRSVSPRRDAMRSVTPARRG